MVKVRAPMPIQHAIRGHQEHHFALQETESSIINIQTLQCENDLTDAHENYPLDQVKKDIGRIKDDFAKNDFNESKSFLSNELDEA